METVALSLNESESSGPCWYGPAERMEVLRGLKGLPISITAAGRVEPAYRLDLPSKQQQLFRDYKEIFTAEDALSWCSLNGVPGYIQSAQKPDTGPHLFEIEDEISESPYTMVDSAEQLRQLINLSNAWQEAVINGNYERLKDLLETERRGSRVRIALTRLSTFYSTDGSNLSPNSLDRISFSQRDWERKQEECLERMARYFLGKAAKLMTGGLQPRLEWEWNEQDDWHLASTFDARCPWRAIGVQFVRSMGIGPNRGKCAHPLCDEPLKRYGDVTCGKNRCVTWYQRNKPPVKKAVRETRKRKS